MSRTITLTESKEISVAQGIAALQELGFEFHQLEYDDGSILIFKYGYSIRGVEISKVKNGFEFRITVMASTADYRLFATTANFFQHMFGGELFDAENKPVVIADDFSEIQIEKYISEDAELLFELISEKKEVSLFGPIREFSIGRNIWEKLSKYESLPFDRRTEELIKLIIASQYPPDNYAQFANMMSVTDNDGNSHYLQVLSNSKEMVVEKVAEYAICKSDTEYFYIEPEHLSKELTDRWIRLDENTFLASILPEKKWGELYEQMLVYSK